MDERLLKRIRQIHADCYKLCKNTFGDYLVNSGNMAVFCQTEKEYTDWNKIREQIVLPSSNPKQKYFTLIEPIIIADAVYLYLYIRKPDPTPYGKYLGDVDFILPSEDYLELKDRLQTGDVIKGAQIYNRPGWDMIQLTDPNINVVAYVSTKEMTEKVHSSF